MLVRQLEEELRMRMRQPNIEMQQQIEALYSENEHLTREIAILRDTIKVSRLQFNFFLTTNYSQLLLYYTPEFEETKDTKTGKFVKI